MKKRSVALLVLLGIAATWTAIRAQATVSLTAPGVTPQSGAPGEYTFSVMYSEPDGMPPYTPGVQLHINDSGSGTPAPGSPFPMATTEPEPSYLTGTIFSATVPLAAGNYEYSFSASSDGETFVTAGPIPDLVVNTPPILSGGSVTPTSGTDTTSFEYRVTYTDADDLAPTFVNVIIDGFQPVTMSRLDSNPFLSGSVFSATTMLSPGLHTFSFEASDGYVLIPVVLQDAGGQPFQGPVNGAKFTGLVTHGGTGVPVANVSVSAGYYSVPTGADGRYTFFVGAGSHVLKAQAPYGENLLDVEFPVDAAVGDHVVHDFVLPVGGILDGTVKDPLNGPVSGASVSVLHLDGTSIASATTDTGGIFSFPRMPGGDVLLDISVSMGTGLVPQRLLVPTVQGQTTTRNVTLEKGAVVNCTVKDPGGAGLSNSRVTVSGSGSFWQGYTTAAGTFTFNALPTGAYRVTAYPPSQNTALREQSVNADLVAGQTYDLVFPLGGPGALKGTVTDNGGAGVAGAQVRATRLTTGANYTRTTDAAGAYRFDSIPGGGYLVEVTPPVQTNLMPGQRTGINVTEGAEATADLQLEVGGTVKGQVKDAAGVPVSGADVYVRLDSGSRYASTDTNGGYTIDRVPRGNWELEVSPPASSQLLSRWHDFVSVAPGQELTRDVTLPTGGVLKVSVTSDGTPISGVYVEAYPSNRHAYSGSDGVATIGPLESGTFAVGVYPTSGSGLAGIVIEGVVVPAGQTVAVDAPLTVKGNITGIVTDASGNPVANAYVRVTGAAYSSTTTGSSGIYSFSSLPMGSYRVTAEPPAGTALLANARNTYLEAGQVRTLDLVLPPSGAINGTVLSSAGSPVAGASVTLKGLEPYFGKTVVTGSDGTFSLAGMPTGVYEIGVMPPAGAPVLSTVISNVLVTAGAVVTQEVRLGAAGSLSGVVRMPGGQPFKGGTSLTANYVRNYDSQSVTVYTGSDGSYLFPQLPAGPVDLGVVPSGPFYPQTIRGLAINTGAETKQDVTLVGTPKPGGIRVMVTSVGAVVNGANAVVYRVGSTYPVASGYTDAAGIVVISNLAPDTYRVSVHPPSDLNALQAGAAGIAVTNDVIADVPVVLPQGGVLEGAVTDAGGVPVLGAMLSLVSTTGNGATYTTTSGADGSYRIEQLPAAVYDLTVQVGAWGTLAGKRIAGIGVSGGQVVKQNVQLTNGASLRGIVTNPTAGKVAGATVVVTNDTGTFTATTDRDGVYVVGRLMAGSYGVSAEPPAGANLMGIPEHTVAVPADAVLQHDMTMPSGSILEGRVLDITNAPVRDACVALSGNGEYRNTTTDGNGAYRFEGLSGSPVDLTVMPPDRLNLAPVRMDDVQLTRGGTTRLDIVARPGATLTGVVSFNGMPLVDARVELNTAEGWGGSVKSDAEGRFTLNRLHPGTYVLGVFPPSDREINAAFHVEYVKVAPGDTVVSRNVALPVEGVLAGVVVDALGQPVTAGTATVYDERNHHRRSANIDGKGNFRVGHLATGRYAIEVRAYNQAAQNLLEQTYTGISVTAGQQTDHNVVLPGGAGLAGKVTDTAGNPVSGAMVRVVANGDGVASAATEGDGSYRFIGLVPGTYTIEVDPPGDRSLEYLSVNGMMLGGLTTLDLVLAPESVATVTVTDGAGGPVAGARVDLEPADRPMYYFGGTAYANAEGVARIGHLPAGLYHLQVAPPSDAGARGLMGRSVAGIRVPRGQVVALGTLSLGATGSIRGQVHDPAGNPVAGIEVEAEGPSGDGSAVTDSGGNYRIGGLGAGLYWVEAMPAPETGWLGRSVSGVRVAAGAATDQNLLLLTAGRLGGRVADPANAPVGGASVTLRGPDGAYASATTGYDGTYAIPGLHSGAYQLSVHPPSGTGLLDVVVSDLRIGDGESATRDVVLPAGGTVQGTVYSPDGTPVLQPRVVLLGEGGQECGVLGGMDGRYRVDGIRTGQYEVLAMATQPDGPAPAPAMVPGIAVTEGQTVTRDLTLAAPGGVLVKVTDPAGNPVVDAAVTLSVIEPQGIAGAEGDATTNSKGEARIAVVHRSGLAGSVGFGLPSSVCAVQVSPWSSADLLPREVGNVQVQAGQETVVPVVLGAGATITGRIEDSAGKGLAHVTVDLLGADGAPPPSGSIIGMASSGGWSVSSDSTGFFHLAGVPAGEYGLFFDPRDEHPLFLAKTVSGVQVASGESVVRNVVLERGAVLSGAVTDSATGDPVPGADVQVKSDPEGVSGYHGHATADSTGKYLLGGVPPGTYRVSAYGPDYLNLAPLSARVSLGPGQDATQDFALPTGGAIEGIVRDEAGAPIPGVSVEVDDGDTSVTDQRGYYRIERLVAGTYDLWLSPPGHTTFSDQRIAAVTVPAGQTVTRDFVLRRCGEVKGRVTTAAGQPVSEARVSVGDARQSLTDSEGYYHIGGVPAGPQSIWVFPHRRSDLLPTRRDGVSVIAGQTAVADFVLAASSMFTGVVKDGAGVGVEGAQVKVVPSERGGTEVQATTDSVGHYVVPNLPAGRFDVTAIPPAGRPEMLGRTEHNVVLGAGATQNLDLVLGQGGTITGSVRDEAGKPVSGSVRIAGVGPDSMGAPVQGGFLRSAALGPDGRYALVGIPAGTFTLWPDIHSSEPLLLQHARVTVASGQTVEKSFVLSKGGRIAGRVLGPAGTGVSARVSILRPDQGFDGAIHVATDEAGYYRASGIAPGTNYRVVVDPLMGQNLVPQEKPAAVAAGQETVVDFQLAGGAILTGRVTDSAGNPVENARVGLAGRPDDYVVTDGAGVYEMRGLSDGTYDLHVAPPAGMAAVGQVVRGITVAAATPATRNVQLPPASRIEGIVQRKTGEPVGGVTVWLFGAGMPTNDVFRSVSDAGAAPSPQLQTQLSRQVGNYWDRMVTGPDGGFAFEGLPAGHFGVVTNRPATGDLAPGEAHVNLTTAGTGAVTVVTPPASGIAGLVSGAAGAPLAGVPVTISGPHSWDETTTDAGGRYAFAGLAPGRHTMEARAPYGEGSGTRKVQVDVPEGANLTQDISLATTGSIGGVAMGAGAPLSGASVRVYGPGHDSYRTTGADGSFLFEHLAAGVFHIVIRPARGASLNDVRDELVLGAGGAIRKDFLLSPATGSISGQVAFTGTQTGSVLVALFEAGPSEYNEGMHDSDSAIKRNARTRGWVAIDDTAMGTETPFLQKGIAAPGPYTIEGVPEGQYHVLAVMDRNGNGQVDPGEPAGKFGKPNAVFIKEGAAVAGIDVTLVLPFAEVDMSLGRVGPRRVAPGGTVSLSVDAMGADLVQAEIFDAATDTSVGVVDLADDGAHNDGSANDGLYGGTFKAPTAAGDFLVAFRAKDAQGNGTVWIGGAGFTTADFQKSARVLLVNVAGDVAGLRVDAQGNAAGGDPFGVPLKGIATVEDYYADALRASGVAFDVWRTTCRGPVDAATLKTYAGADGAVIVAWPYQNPAMMDGLSGDGIAQFLDAGGRLFISGQDVAWEAEGEDRYRFNPVFREYLGAGLVSGGASFELSGRPGDVLSDNMRFRVSGGDGANNQSSPDAIVALPPAQPIFHYEEGLAAHTRAVAQRAGGAKVLFPQARGRRAPGRAFSTGGDGPLCGGLRLDNGRYKVVYLAFGLEGIADANQRALLMRRSLSFLAGPLSDATKIEASASPTTLPADGASEATVTVSVANASGAVPDGTLVSFRGYNASAPASARTTGGGVTIPVRAGDKRGPMTVAISSGAALTNVVLNATPAPAGVIGARSLGGNSAEVVFDRPMDKATAENPANYSITPALGVTAAALASEPDRVRLTTEAQIGVPYQVTVTGVLDAGGQPLGVRRSSTFLGTGPAPGIAVATAAAQIIANGKDAVTITATVTAPGGGPVGDGTPVIFTSTLGAVTPVVATTSGGKASTTLTARIPGVAKVTAVVGKAVASSDVEVLDASPAGITLTADPVKLTTSGAETSVISAAVTDVLNRPMDGVSVTFTTDFGTVTPEAASTVAGVATTAASSTSPGTATITAKTANGKSATVAVTYVAEGVATLTVAAAATELPADGASTSVLTITVKDGVDRPIADGTTVELQTDLGSVPATATTTGGQATVAYTAGTTVGTATITVKAGGVTQTVQMALKNPTAGIVGVSKATFLTNDGMSTTEVTFTLTDSTGRPVPDGLAVSLTTTLGTVPASATTSGGAVTVAFTSATQTGTATVTATCGTASGSVGIKIVLPATAQGTISTTDGAPLPAGTAIELRDKNGTVFATGIVSADGTFSIASEVSGTFDLVVLPPKGSKLIPVLIPDLDLTQRSRAALQNVSAKLLPQPQLAPGPGLAMVTVPFAFRNGAVESVVGDPDAVLYWYDSAAKRYRIAGIDGVPPAVTGRGFWAKPRRGGTAYGIEEPAIVPAQDQEVTLSLAKGWQIIGSPYATSNITLSQVKVLLPGSTTPLSLGDPATTNQIRNYLWTHNGTTYDLVSAMPEGKTTTMAAYQGYWVRTLVDGVRLVFSPPASSTESKAEPQRAAPAGWRAQIHAGISGRTQSAGSFGIGPSAYSIDAPPSPSGHIAVRFVTAGGGRAAVSVLDEGSAAGWAFEVDTSGIAEGEEVAVTWPGLGSVPRKTRLVLVDEQTGRRWQMRTTPSVNFRANGAPYRFRIEAEAANGALASITGITLTKVRGSGRSIGYVLSTDATATVAIKSPTDRTLCRVVAGRAVGKGRNEAYWDGRDERGIAVKGLVLVEITATTGEGATVRALRPAMLVD